MKRIQLIILKIVLGNWEILTKLTSINQNLHQNWESTWELDPKAYVKPYLHERDNLKLRVISKIYPTMNYIHQTYSQKRNGKLI